MFHIGQKICCINDAMCVTYRKPGMFARFRRFVFLDHNLNKGDVYVVEGLALLKCRATGVRHESVLVRGAWHFGYRWMPFPAFQFRAVAERETDISVFTEMLAKTTMPVRV